MKTSMKTLAVLLVLVALAYAAWRYTGHDAPPLAALVREAPERVRAALDPPTLPTDAASTDARPDAGVEHPIATDPYTSLPMLDGSDGEFLAELAALAPADALARSLEAQGLIRRLVVAVDNLPGGKLPLKQRPVKPVDGEFVVSGDDDALTIDPANFARYTPLVSALESLDTAALTALYRRYYPLFQQAYQELGYPDAYFNDRLVAVIDHLLAAAPFDAPLRLVRPNVLYRYADPALEARSPGQKILLRIGPDNAARVQAVLTRWRAALVQTPAP